MKENCRVRCGRPRGSLEHADDWEQAVVVLSTQRHLGFPWVRHEGLCFRIDSRLYNQKAFLFHDRGWNRSACAHTPLQSWHKSKPGEESATNSSALTFSGSTSKTRSIIRKRLYNCEKLSAKETVDHSSDIWTFLGWKTNDSSTPPVWSQETSLWRAGLIDTPQKRQD